MPSSFLSNRLYECIGPTKFHHQISLLSTCILTCKNFQKFTWDFIWFALLWEFTDTILREITCWIPETENTFQSPSILIPSHPICKKMCLFQRGLLSMVKDHQLWNVHGRNSLPATNWKYSTSVSFALFVYSVSCLFSAFQTIQWFPAQWSVPWWDGVVVVLRLLSAAISTSRVDARLQFWRAWNGLSTRNELR